MNVLGFNLDWHAEDDGIAGISRGACLLFLADPAFRESHGNRSPMLSWLNLASKAEVDSIFTEWQASKARMISEPADTPWNLREFTVADLDGNLIRVFYDFTNDESRLTPATLSDPAPEAHHTTAASRVEKPETDPPARR